MINNFFILLVYSLRRGYMSEPESGSGKPRKMAELGPKKYEGIGPTTKDGMPITLRSVWSFKLLVYKTDFNV